MVYVVIGDGVEEEQAAKKVRAPAGASCPQNSLSWTVPASAVSVEQTADALRALRPGQAAQSEVGSDPCEGRRA